MDEVKSTEEIFKSRSVASQVVDRLGPDVVLGRGTGSGGGNVVHSIITKPISVFVNLVKSIDPISEKEEAILSIERNLRVSSERQSTVIVVAYNAPSPQLAQSICEAIVNVGQEEHIRVHRSEASSPFFTEQQLRLREQLDQSLEALSAAKSEMGLANVEQRRKTLEAQYSAIELDRLKTNQQLATAQATIEDLQRQLAEIPERTIDSKRSVPNLGADILRDRLYELQVKSMDLEARYSKTHPLVRAANDQLNEAKKVLEEQSEQRTETNDAINTIHRDLSLAMKQQHSVVAGLRSRDVELNQQKDAVLADLRALNQHDIKIDQLTRDTELARGKFMQYARTMEEARIDKELQNEGVSNISVVQPATLAEKPVSPSRRLTFAGTILLAVAGTFGLVLLNEGPNGAMLPATATSVPKRRLPRRVARPELGAKTNGQSAAKEMHTVPE
jgi:uncharacterized protein involved in exopolysaccharide biosynthesis